LCNSVDEPRGIGRSCVLPAFLFLSCCCTACLSAYLAAPLSPSASHLHRFLLNNNNDDSISRLYQQHSISWWFDLRQRLPVERTLLARLHTHARTHTRQKSTLLYHAKMPRISRSTGMLSRELDSLARYLPCSYRVSRISDDDSSVVSVVAEEPHIYSGRYHPAAQTNRAQRCRRR